MNVLSRTKLLIFLAFTLYLTDVQMLAAQQITLVPPSISISSQRGMQDTPDTMALTLSDAESQFLRANLSLLAAKYSIEAARAAVVQAQLFPNPNISLGHNAYNANTGEILSFGQNSNTDIVLQQLIQLAGKRSKQARVAEINANITESSFFDLLRSLKLTLRTNFFDLYYAQQTLAFYDRTIPSLRKTITSAEEMYTKRTLLLSELLRLKSLLLTLENERSGYVVQIDTLQAGMHLLMNTADSQSVYHSRYLVPQLDPNRIAAVRPDTLGMEALLRIASENRPDFKAAQQQVQAGDANLSLQQALAVPDVTVGVQYSKAGSAFPDYLALTASIDIPIFSRNQGNIQVAEYTFEGAKRLAEQAKHSLERDVIAAYKTALERDRLFRTFDQTFSQQYQTLMDGITANYAKRNMTIIEFTDFYESYRASSVQILQALQARSEAFEQLNYTLGTTLLNR